MILKLIRTNFTPTTTIGELYINDVFFCHVLEDVDRDLVSTMPLEEISKVKIFGETAIPYGSYQVVITYSEKFKRYLPLLLNVPGFLGIRLHSGNFVSQTEGCPLIGVKHLDGYIANSRITFDKLFEQLKAIEKKEKIILTISKN